MVALGGDNDTRLAMTYVTPDALPFATSSGSAAEMSVTLRVSGMTRAEYLAPMNTFFEKWKKDEAAAVTLEGYRIYITAVDKNVVVN